MPDRVDDGSIGDDQILWRRIVVPDWCPEGHDRPAKVAFIDRLSGELSVHWSIKTTREKVLHGFPDDKIAAFRAGLPRQLGYKVVPDPDEDDPSHVLICPTPHGAKARTIAKEC